MIAVNFLNDISTGNIITVVAAAIAGLGAFYDLRARSKANAYRIEEIEKRINAFQPEKICERVDTMWLFQLRRGVAEVEIKGLGKANSPLRLSDEANKFMEPLLPELKSFYRAINGENMSLVDLAVALEQQFGPRLVSEVCKIIGVSDAACLVLAIGQLRPIVPTVLKTATEICHTGISNENP